MRVALLTCSVVLCFMTLAATSLAAAPPKPDEASLLMAWEAAQRGDSKTELFDRVAPGRYRFKTARFPYDGELLVSNLSIDEMGYENWIMGVVEVELPGADEAFLRTHGYSFGAWQRDNVLYYDMDRGIWIAADEWQKRLRKAATTEGTSEVLEVLRGGGTYIAMLVVLVIVLLFVARKASRQYNKAMAKQEEGLDGVKRSLRIQEEALAGQRESLDLLRALLAGQEETNRLLPIAIKRES